VLKQAQFSFSSRENIVLVLCYFFYYYCYVEYAFIITFLLLSRYYHRPSGVVAKRKKGEMRENAIWKEVGFILDKLNMYVSRHTNNESNSEKVCYGNSGEPYRVTQIHDLQFMTPAF
jgi:hypothetical protein